MNHLSRASSASIGLLIAAAPLKASVDITAQNGSTGTFTVSSTDIGQTSAVFSLDSGAADFGSSVSALNDGDIYGGAGSDNTSPTLTPTAGAIATLHFDLGGGSPFGYDISSIVSLTGTAQGMARQFYDVAYMRYGGSGFTPLATVPQDLPGNGQQGETQVTISNTDLSRVVALQFTFHAPAGSPFADGGMFREIDVFGSGSAIPEPGEFLGAAGLTLTGFFALRRFRK